MSKIPTPHLFRFETFFQIFFLDSPTRQWGQEKRKRKKIVEHFSCFAVAFRWRKRRYIIVITCTRDQLRAPTPLSFSSSVRGKGRRQPKWRDVTQRSFFRDLKGRKLSKKKNEGRWPPFIHCLTNYAIRYFLIFLGIILCKLSARLCGRLNENHEKIQNNWLIFFFKWKILN